jgi:hypothetical protein
MTSRKAKEQVKHVGEILWGKIRCFTGNHDDRIPIERKEKYKAWKMPIGDLFPFDDVLEQDGNSCSSILRRSVYVALGLDNDIYLAVRP